MEKKNYKIFIDDSWINGRDYFYNNNSFEIYNIKSATAKMRKAFVEKLKNEGFFIITDQKEIDENTICLIMDRTTISSKDMSTKEYKKLFDKKMSEGAGENFHYPNTLSINEYFKNPFFPAVFKNEYENGGVDKFLIQNEEHLEKLIAFYNEYQNNPKYREVFDYIVLQQYLKNPGKYASYLRVLVAGSGDVMGASLKYSARCSYDDKLTGLFENVFLNPKSRYYIETEKMFNYYSGGQNISFNQPRFSSEKAKILDEHGFDVDNLKLPEAVLDVSKNLMENCNRELGIMCGIDYMLNESDGKWYYLENQAFPAIEEWAEIKRISLPKPRNMKSCLKYLEFELQARYEALMLTIGKKEGKKLSLK